MTIDQIVAELDALVETATPAPWQADGLPYDGCDDPCIFGPGEVYVAQTVYDGLSNTKKHNIEADTRLIVSLRNHWPAIRTALTAASQT